MVQRAGLLLVQERRCSSNCSTAQHSSVLMTAGTDCARVKITRAYSGPGRTLLSTPALGWNDADVGGRTATGGPRAVRVRQAVNAVTLATPLGLALARWGRAHVVQGPDGLLLALDYCLPVPAPNAPAVTVGDVVLLRMSSAELMGRPRLLAHEGRHAVQWACWLGPVGFLPAYLLASAWSWLRCRDFARHNAFEIRAGLVDGGYVRADADQPV